jgi:hypothetical protein
VICLLLKSCGGLEGYGRLVLERKGNLGVEVVVVVVDYPLCQILTSRRLFFHSFVSLSFVRVVL